jgi:hypothetical protein
LAESHAAKQFHVAQIKTSLIGSNAFQPVMTETKTIPAISKGDVYAKPF